MAFRYISADEHTTNTERVLRAYRTLVYRSPRMTRVFLACAFIRHAHKHAQNCARSSTHQANGHESKTLVQRARRKSNE